MLKKQQKPKRFTKARDGITKTPLKDATAAQYKEKTIKVGYW